MKNISIAKSAKEKALQAVDAFLNNPHRPEGYCLADHILFALGGPDECLESFHDSRDAVKVLLEILERDQRMVHYEAAYGLLNNMLLLCEALIEDTYTEAELLKIVIERDNTMVVDAHLTDERLEIIARQYELKLKLAALESEEKDIRYREKERKAA